MITYKGKKIKRDDNYVKKSGHTVNVGLDNSGTILSHVLSDVLNG